MKITKFLLLLIPVITLSILVLGHTTVSDATVHTEKGHKKMDSRHRLMQWLNGHEIDVHISDKRPPESEEVIAEGKKIYSKTCKHCHGDKGDGKGHHAEGFKTVPTDFTQGIYKFRTTPSGSLPRDDDIYSTISCGIRGTSMLPWIDLTDRKKWAVTYYIKTLSPSFEEEEADAAISVPDMNAANQELVMRGKELYEKTKCWECHGMEGRGNGPKVDELKNDNGKKTRPRDFTREPFKRGQGVHGIYLTLVTGMDGTPMASFLGGRTEDELFSIAVYVNSLTGGFASKMPMSPDEQQGMDIYLHIATGEPLQHQNKHLH